MDKLPGSNLEALREEDNEDESIGDGLSSDEDDDEGIRQKEPNQFDKLCDGVINSTALLHETLREYLTVKDELLTHSLPPTVLVSLSLVSGKLFRSISDINQPINELLRLVRVFSTPWEEKSAALRKLHEEYETKQRQLNIAIKRLQLVESHSKRIARDKRLMNWEKLFSKLTSSKGHGRRWKFLIESFKEKANKGMEYLQEYTRRLDETDDESSSDEEYVEDKARVETAVAVAEKSEQSESEVEEPHKSEEEEDTEDEKSASSPTNSHANVHLNEEVEKESSGGSAKQVRFHEEEEEEELPKVIKPPMVDQQVWTHEPEYNRSLFIRIFKPEGLDVRGIKCVVNYGHQFFKTGELDPSPEVEEVDDKKGQSSATVRGRGRGLMGTRGGRGGGRPGAAGSKPKVEEKPADAAPDYEAIRIRMPDEIPEHVRLSMGWREKDQRDDLKIAIHYGPNEEMHSMATIDMDDLTALDLPVVYEPAPIGDVPLWDLERVRSASQSPDDPLHGVLPVNFPLYSIHAGKSDALHQPAAQLPLVCYWSKTLRPRMKNRNTECWSVREIVLEETGYDLNDVTKEDIWPEKVDEALSAKSMSPQPEPEETVPRSEVEEIMDAHDQEINMLRSEYESKLTNLVARMEEMEGEMQEMQRISADSMRAFHSEPPPTAPKEEKPKRRVIKQESAGKPKKNFMIGRPLPKWGESYPKDFFERMQVLEEEMAVRKQALRSEIQREISTDIEKKLSSQYKMSRPGRTEMYDALKEVSLPALFMPVRNSNNVYNPRAHQYFHPTGSSDMRLTQPPSMMHLPPLDQNKLSVVNLFDLSQNFHSKGPEWLFNKYMISQDDFVTPEPKKAPTPLTPAPTLNRTNNNTFVEKDRQSSSAPAGNGPLINETDLPSSSAPMNVMTRETSIPPPEVYSPAAHESPAVLTRIDSVSATSSAMGT